MNLKKFIVSAIALVAVFALAAGSVSAAYTHTGTLKMGMTSSQVMSLQQTLNANGYMVSATGAGSVGLESMYFGAKTKAAVMSFQMAKGLGSDGIVGPMTGAALGALSGNFPAGCTSAAGYSTTTGLPCSSVNAATFAPAGCTSASGYSPVTGGACYAVGGGSTDNSGGLSGTVGSLDYSLVSSLSNEEVGEDANDVKIAGLELDAEDSDSDVRVTSVKIEFAQGTATNDDFDEFADDVTVWLGSTKVGSVDASEFNDDNDYTKTISLSNAVVRMNDSEDLVVAVSGVSNVDSDDEGDTWTVNFDQIRFVDAQGATTTEDPGTATRTFSFESFAAANDVGLEVSLNSDEDDINDARTITVDEDDETENVSILAFTIEASGDSDVNVDEISVLLTTNDAIDQVIESVDLYHGTTKVGSEDASGAGSTDTVTFDDLDLDIDAGDEAEFTVKVNLLNTDDYTSGTTTIKAELGSTEVDAIDAEDETGEEISTTDLTGTAIGEAHTLSTTQADIEVTSSSSSKNEAETVATYTFQVTVSAENGDVQVDAASVVTTRLGTAGGTTVESIINLDGDATVNGSNDFTVEDGESDVTFAITVTVDPTVAGTYYVRLDSIDGVVLDKLVGPQTLDA